MVLRENLERSVERALRQNSLGKVRKETCGSIGFHNKAEILQYSQSKICAETRWPLSFGTIDCLKCRNVLFRDVQGQDLWCRGPHLEASCAQLLGEH